MGEAPPTGRIGTPAAERPALLPLLAGHVRPTRAGPGRLAFEVASDLPPDHRGEHLP